MFQNNYHPDLVYMTKEQFPMIVLVLDGNIDWSYSRDRGCNHAHVVLTVYATFMIST